MIRNSTDLLFGEILDESAKYSLSDLCDRCGVEHTEVVSIVQYGIVEPEGDRPDTWRFSSVAAFRVHRAIRLQTELGLNLAGAALGLDLLDAIARLRRELRARG